MFIRIKPHKLLAGSRRYSKTKLSASQQNMLSIGQCQVLGTLSMGQTPGQLSEQTHKSLKLSTTAAYRVSLHGISHIKQRNE